MSTTSTVVTVLTAAWIGFSAFSLLRRADFVTQPLVEYAVPRTWRTVLGSFGLLGVIATFTIGAAA